jgi:hypothetical protein
MTGKKKIEFIAKNKHVLEVREAPKPASEFIPQWWKDMPVHSHGNKPQLTPKPNYTAKRCFPLLDSMTAGYIFTLWADLLVSKDSQGTKIVQWNTVEPVCEAWDLAQSVNYEVPDGFSKTVFKYLHGWRIKTPKGYSSFITHPISYPNLPIRTLTGIVDTDALETYANSPFVIHKDFEGIIEKGTPMFQVIPFKRDSWVSSVAAGTDDERFFASERLHSRIVSSYGRYLRSDKKYK